MRLPISLTATVLLIFAAPPVPAQTTAVTALPDWLAGHWCLQGGSEQQGVEYWLPAAGNMMLGLSRTVVNGRPTQFEFQRIEMIDAAPTFIAQPQGLPPTAFRYAAGGTDWMRFENPDHDFPQRVQYRRSGDDLHAEIAGPGKDGESMVIRFDFKRCPD